MEIKKDLVWIEQWEEMNRIKFKREVYNFLLLSGKNKKYAYTMGKSDLAIAQGSGCCCQPQITVNMGQYYESVAKRLILSCSTLMVQDHRK